MQTGRLSHTPAEIIAQLLIDLGCGVAASLDDDWSTTSTNEPDRPDNSITVYDTEGNQDGRSMVTGEVWKHHGVQVRVRGKDHNVANNKAEEIKYNLDQVVLRNTVTVETSTYVVYCVSRRSGPLSIGKESPSSRRIVFTLNAVVALRQVS